jgi:hypothetical protein
MAKSLSDPIAQHNKKATNGLLFSLMFIDVFTHFPALRTFTELRMAIQKTRSLVVMNCDEYCDAIQDDVVGCWSLLPLLFS